MNRRVFILGAGASKACGLPLTNELLPSVIDSIDKQLIRNQLLEFIRYLYPHFHEEWGNYPNLEEFLSLFDVYKEFSPKVKKKHKFDPKAIGKLKDELLRAVSIYLNDSISDARIEKTNMYALAARSRRGDTIITFNWDLCLERALKSAGSLDTLSYVQKNDGLTLLKPHGSVNWFDDRKISLKKKLTYPLIPANGHLRVFRPFRYPKISKRIVPVIIPPVFKKKWPHPEFDKIWRDSWKALRRADELYIIGFSLPPEDLHVRFVIRSAIRVNEANRSKPLKVAVVNPDRTVFLRFARLLKTRIDYFESGFERIPLDQLTGKPSEIAKGRKKSKPPL